MAALDPDSLCYKAIDSGVRDAPLDRRTCCGLATEAGGFFIIFNLSIIN
jgi:hypothetical protein